MSDEALDDLIPFSGVLARAAIQRLEQLPADALADADVCRLNVVEPASDPRLQIMHVALNTRSHRDSDAGIDPRLDDQAFAFSEVALVGDPDSDTANAGRWRRYAAEGLGVWDEATPEQPEFEDDLHDLRLAFQSATIEAARDVKDWFGTVAREPVLMAVYAQDLEITYVEANEQANAGSLPSDARDFWQTYDDDRA